MVLLDGRSGAGKSSLADALIAAAHDRGVPARLIRVEDMYPGWDGLASAAAAVARDLLAPLAQGRQGTWVQYDWDAGATGATHAVEPGAPLLVEGVGALTRESAPLATWRVWLEADAATRKRRALERDGETYAPHWDRWARQEEALLAAHDPAALADEVIRTG